MAVIRFPNPNLQPVPNKVISFDDWSGGMATSVEGDTRNAKISQLLRNFTNRYQGKLVLQSASSNYYTHSDVNKIQSYELVYANDNEYILAWKYDSGSTTHTLEISKVEATPAWTVLYTFSTSDNVDDVDMATASSDGRSVIYVSYKKDDGSGGLLRVEYKYEIDTIPYIKWTTMTHDTHTSDQVTFQKENSGSTADNYGTFLDYTGSYPSEVDLTEELAVNDVVIVAVFNGTPGTSAESIDMSNISHVAICRVVDVPSTTRAELDRTPFPGKNMTTYGIGKLSMDHIGTQYSTEGWHCRAQDQPIPHDSLWTNLATTGLTINSVWEDLSGEKLTTGFAQAESVMYGFSYELEGGQHTPLLVGSWVVSKDDDIDLEDCAAIRLPIQCIYPYLTTSEWLFYHAYRDDSPYTAEEEICAVNVWRRKSGETEWGFLARIPRTGDKPFTTVDDFYADGATAFVRNIGTGDTKLVFVRVERVDYTVGRVLDSYSEDHRDWNFLLDSGGDTVASQSIKPTRSCDITNIRFLLKKSSSPTGNAYAKVYTVTGSHGSTARPADLGSPLGTSDAVDVSGISATDWELVSFPFSTPCTVSGGTAYCITVEYGGSGGSVMVGIDTSALGHDGNAATYDPTVWTLWPSVDLCFYVDIEPLAHTIIGFDQYFKDAGDVLSDTYETVTGVSPRDAENLVAGGRLASYGQRLLVGNTIFPYNHSTLDKRVLDDDVIYSVSDCGMMFALDSVIGLREGESDSIVDVATAGPNLIILKNNSVGIINIAGAGELAWTPRGSFPYGCLYPGLVTVTPRGPCWMSHDGIYAFVENEPVNIAREIYDEYTAASGGAYSASCHLGYEPRFNRLYLMLGDNTYYWYGLDSIEHGWKQFDGGGVLPRVAESGVLVVKGSGNLVQIEDSSEDATTYDATWDSGTYTLGPCGEGIKLKCVYVWYSYERPTTGYNTVSLTLKWYLDGSSTPSGTRTLSIDGTRDTRHINLERLNVYGRARTVRFQLVADNDAPDDYFDYLDIRKIEVVYKTTRLK